MTEPYVTAHVVAERLGVSKATVIRRYETGELPGYRLWGRSRAALRFKWSEIEEALSAWKGEAGAGGEAPATPSERPPVHSVDHSSFTAGRDRFGGASNPDSHGGEDD